LVRLERKLRVAVFPVVDGPDLRGRRARSVPGPRPRRRWTAAGRPTCTWRGVADPSPITALAAYRARNEKKIRSRSAGGVEGKLLARLPTGVGLRLWPQPPCCCRPGMRRKKRLEGERADGLAGRYSSTGFSVHRTTSLCVTGRPGRRRRELRIPRQGFSGGRMELRFFIEVLCFSSFCCRCWGVFGFGSDTDFRPEVDGSRRFSRAIRRRSVP